MKARAAIATLLMVAFGAILVYALWGARPARTQAVRHEWVASPNGAMPPGPVAIPVGGAPALCALGMAEPGAAERMGLRPEQSARIARIVADLNGECANVMRRGVADWEEAGGFRAGAPPNFGDRQSPYGEVLAGMRRVAEQRIVAVLTADQRQRMGVTVSATAPPRLASPAVADARTSGGPGTWPLP